MNNFNLRDMAIEILRIDQQFYPRIAHLFQLGVRQSDYRLHTFEQVWGNMSGGFEGIGGSAMTTQRTYVFVPTHTHDDMCLVFFAGTYAYSVPYSRKFIEDVKNENILGKSDYRRYFAEKEGV